MKWFFPFNGLVSALLIVDAAHSFYLGQVEGGAFLLWLSSVLALASVFRRLFYIQMAFLLYFICSVGVFIEVFIPSAEGVGGLPPAAFAFMGLLSLLMSGLAFFAARYELQKKTERPGASSIQPNCSSQEIQAK